MKYALPFLFALGTLALFTSGCQEDTPDDTPESAEVPVSDVNTLDYTVYEDYLVEENFAVDTPTVFRIINDSSEVNEVFVRAADVEVPRYISEDAFQDSTAIAIIKRFQGLAPAMNADQIALVDSTLQISYSLTGMENTVAYDTKPYILVMIGEDRFKEVEFFENGDLVKQMTP